VEASTSTSDEVELVHAFGYLYGVIRPSCNATVQDLCEVVGSVLVEQLLASRANLRVSPIPYRSKSKVSPTDRSQEQSRLYANRFPRA